MIKVSGYVLRGPPRRRGSVDQRESGQLGAERNVTVAVTQQLRLACVILNRCGQPRTRMVMAWSGVTGETLKKYTTVCSWPLKKEGRFTERLRRVKQNGVV